MYKHTLKIAMITTAFVSAIVSSTAFAGPDCTSEPKDTWMSEMVMQKKIINDYGFTIHMFKTTDGNCYEIYGTTVKEDESKTSDDKDNTDKVKERVKTEVYFHPVSGDIVKQRIKD